MSFGIRFVFVCAVSAGGLAVGVVSPAAGAPIQSGRCSGVGSGSGASAALTCFGQCGDYECDVATTVRGSITYAFCSCTDDPPACCHVVLRSPGTAFSAWQSGGDCPSCGTTGVCTVVSVGTNIQAACQTIIPE